MSLNEDVERLRKIPLFAKIEPSKLKLLAFTAQRLTFNANESLFHQGDGLGVFIVQNRIETPIEQFLLRAPLDGGGGGDGGLIDDDDFLVEVTARLRRTGAA